MSPLSGILPVPNEPAHIASIVFETAGLKSLSAGIATFGHVFAPGEVAEGQALLAWVGGQDSAVQLDVKTTYEDGSVRMAVLSMQRPALAAGAMVEAMLHEAPAGTPQARDLSMLAGLSGHSFMVDLAATGHAALKIDVLAALRGGLQDGTASSWLDGPLAVQSRIAVDGPGSLRMVFDVTAYAGGGFAVEAQFNNDGAMTSDGGRIAYRLAIAMDGKSVASETLDQGQYQNWHRSFSVDGEDGGQGTGGLNIRQDIAHLADTGAIAQYNLAIGVEDALLDAWGAAAAAPGSAAPLAINGVTQFMPGTGGRDDIGFTTAANTAWLMTGDARVANFAMAQAEAAGAVPWHLWDAAAGSWLSATDHPGLWTDPRGGTNSLTQQPDAKSGWTADSAHQPDLSYVPYVMTGERWMLDNLQAQAAWNVVSNWPDARGESGLLVVKDNQVRGAAWALRQIDEAAWASPDGSAAKAQFTAVSEANWGWLVDQLPAWTAQQGEAHGWLPGDYGTTGALPPWQQDYFASTALAAARRGNADALTYLEWASNFLVGRFTHAAQGFAEHDGAAYLIAIADTATGLPYTSWARIGAETVARGWSNGEGWNQSQGDYAQLALATLAGLAEVTGSSIAAAAYHALRADGAPFTGAADFAKDPTYAIAPPNATPVGPPIGPSTPPTAEAVPSLGEGAHVVRLSLSEDAWDGDARFAVLLDGVMLGTNRVVTAEHAAGETQVLDIRMNQATGHQLTVRFLNDAWGGTSDTDRNLYVDDILIHGLSTGRSAVLTMTGDVEFAILPPDDPLIPRIGTGANTIRIGVSGDAWRGAASFTLLLDGADLLQDFLATASHASGATAYIDVKTDLGAAAHALTVRFTNDEFGGSAETDRNLYVDSIAIDGVDQGRDAALLREGEASFVIVASSAPPRGLALGGGHGVDTLWGGAGADTLDGAAGADNLVGGIGNDTYIVDSPLDRIRELGLGGIDTVLSSVSYTLTAELEHLTLTGAAAIDGTGNTLANRITGNASANVLTGGAGDDLYHVDALDRVVELAGGGADTVISASSFNLDGMEHIEVLQFTGTAVANGIGNAGDNSILGNSAANILTGGLGKDTIEGGAGNDTLRGGEGADRLLGGVGTDRLEGGAGDDVYVIADLDSISEGANSGRDLVMASIGFTLGGNVEDLTLTGASAIDGRGNNLANVLTGNAAANLLDGMTGADTLSGSDGNDTLIGGQGADTMAGGAGSDIFRYMASTERGDVITDYRAVDDWIEVSAFGFGGGLVAGIDLAGTGRFLSNLSGRASAAHGQFTFETDAHTLWWDPDGTGAGGRVAVATLTGLTSLAASELVVIA